MAGPTRGPGTGTTSIEVLWGLLTSPADGFSPVTSYQLDWDAGAGPGGAWQSLAGVATNYLQSSYVVTSGAGVTAGAAYRFRLRAVNFWGPGAYSPATTIVAARAPAQPGAPSTTVDPATGDVVVSWVAPDGQGDPITTYTVEIEGASPGAWSAESTHCGGSAAASDSRLAPLALRK